jgi:hypothetical protein
MAKTKQQTPASASQRRQQERQRRESRMQELNTGKTSSTQSRKRRVVHNKTNPWPMVVGVIVVVALVIGIFVYISSQQQSSTTSATPSVQKALTSLDAQLYATVGAGSVSTAAKSTFLPTQGNPAVLKGTDGKPEIFYMGAEFCPYCAAQRWGIITALSRFGSFSTLKPIIASEGNVPTYSFEGNIYTSQYIDFVHVEVEDNNKNNLDTLSAAQQQIINTYDAPPYTQGTGNFPFVSVANQRVETGAFYDYNLLIGSDHASIVNQIKDSSTSISQGVIGTANYLTAAICSVTNNQPANVCQEGAIPGLQKSMSATAFNPDAQHLALMTTPQDFIVPRRGSAF